MPNESKATAELSSSANWSDVVCLAVMKTKGAFLLLLVVAVACTSAVISPGATFLAGLNNYQDEMDRLSGRSDRWPDRQKLAESIKTTYVTTLGGSKEFNRLVDLDLRRREFLITLQLETVTPEREKEMKAELIRIHGQMEELKKIVKGQIARVESRDPAQSQGIENVATIGLLDLAMDSFVVPIPPSAPPAMSTRVGAYLVTDEGNLSTVQTPDGQTFRCRTTVIPDSGASIKCVPVGGKG
jgi:hypothetical protein